MSGKGKEKRPGEYPGRILRIIASAFFIGLTAVFPLYITGTRYAFITRQKTFFFYGLTAVAAAASIAAAFFFTSRLQVKRYFGENNPLRHVPVYGWALLAFIILTLLSAVLSPWQDVVWTGYTLDELTGRWEGFWVFLCYVTAFFLIARFYRPKRAHLLIFAASAVLMSLYGILQFMGWDILSAVGFYDPAYINLAEGGLTASYRATLGNINVVSAYCALTSVLFAALFAGESSKWSGLYLTAGVMSFALLLICNGDAGKIGVLGGMVLFIPYWLSDRRRLGKICLTLSGWSLVYWGYQGYLGFMKRRAESVPMTSPNDQYYLQMYEPQNLAPYVTFAVILAVLGLCLIFLVKKWPGKPMKIISAVILALMAAGGLLFVEVMGERWSGQPENIVWQAREMLHGRLDDSFGTNRGWVWKRGLSVIPDNPILGTGPDTFLFALGVEGQVEAVNRYGVTFDKAHNSFLQIAVCLGLPALLAYLVFLGGLFSGAVKKAFEQPLLLAFGAAAVSFLIQSFFEVDTPIDRPILWAVLGVIAGEIRLGRGSADEVTK